MAEIIFDKKTSFPISEKLKKRSKFDHAKGLTYGVRQTGFQKPKTKNQPFNIPREKKPQGPKK